MSPSLSQLPGRRATVFMTLSSPSLGLTAPCGIASGLSNSKFSMGHEYVRCRLEEVGPPPSAASLCPPECRQRPLEACHSWITSLHQQQETHHLGDSSKKVGDEHESVLWGHAWHCGHRHSYAYCSRLPLANCGLKAGTKPEQAST